MLMIPACSRTSGSPSSAWSPSLFGVGGGWGFDPGRRARACCCASRACSPRFTLVLDFDMIEKGVAAGLPRAESWRAAFGLMVTLVWLYLELLRLLAILSGRD